MSYIVDLKIILPDGTEKTTQLTSEMIEYFAEKSESALDMSLESLLWDLNIPTKISKKSLDNR